MPRVDDHTRFSNVDFDDCVECAVDIGSGVCSNCEADGSYCAECTGGNCVYCDGTGRMPVKVDPAYRAMVEQAGPLIPPET